METTTIIKGVLVFGLTFGFFVLAKQASPPTRSLETVSRETSPDPSPAGLEPTPSETKPAQTASQPLNPQADQSEPSSDSSSQLEAAPPDVVTLLGSWRQAIAANDPHLETSYYAATVKNYYGRSNVDAETVETDKQAFINSGNQVTGLALRNVSLQDVTPDSLRIRLIKDVVWQGSGGEVHRMIPSTLDIEKFSDGWKITGEQDAAK